MISLDATKAVASAFRNNQVTCHEKAIGRYERLVAVCYLKDGTDLGALMVWRG